MKISLFILNVFDFQFTGVIIDNAYVVKNLKFRQTKQSNIGYR